MASLSSLLNAIASNPPQAHRPFNGPTLDDMLSAQPQLTANELVRLLPTLPSLEDIMSSLPSRSAYDPSPIGAGANPNRAPVGRSRGWPIGPPDASVPTVEEIMAGVEARGAASPEGQLLAALKAANAQGLPGMTMGNYGGLPPEAQGQVQNWSSGFGPKPDAMAELMQQYGAAIDTSGNMGPNKPYPGIRSMPLMPEGQGFYGETLNDPRRTFIPDNDPNFGGPSPQDLEARNFAAMAGLRGMDYMPGDEPGAMMGNDGRPLPGASGIKDNGVWWTKSGIPPEMAEKSLAGAANLRQNERFKQGEGRAKLTQRSQEKALARHQRMGTSTLPEMLRVLSGANADPAMAAGVLFGPQGYAAATDAGTQRANMQNQNTLNADPMRQYLAYLSGLPNNAVPLSPKDWMAQIKGAFGGGVMPSDQLPSDPTELLIEGQRQASSGAITPASRAFLTDVWDNRESEWDDTSMFGGNSLDFTVSHEKLREAWIRNVSTKYGIPPAILEQYYNERQGINTNANKPAPLGPEYATPKMM